MSDCHDFEKCTRKSIKNGVMTIECKIGLWSVSGADVDRVINEAKHYFIQYYYDGEYDKLLNKGE